MGGKSMTCTYWKVEAVAGGKWQRRGGGASHTGVRQWTRFEQRDMK